MMARSSTTISPEEAGVGPEHLKLFIDLIFGSCVATVRDVI
jgi:hypothetical protein